MSGVITKEYVCVVCPNGCLIKAAFTGDGSRHLLSSEGQQCRRGDAWIKQEIEAPLRTFSTSVPVEDGESIQTSVRITKAVPLAKVFEVMAEIKKLCPKAPLKTGDVLLRNPAGTATEVIVTRSVRVRGAP